MRKICALFFLLCYVCTALAAAPRVSAARRPSAQFVGAYTVTSSQCETCDARSCRPVACSMDTITLKLSNSAVQKVCIEMLQAENKTERCFQNFDLSTEIARHYGELSLIGGDASYYEVKEQGNENINASWSYESSGSAAARLVFSKLHSWFDVNMKYDFLIENQVYSLKKN